MTLKHSYEYTQKVSFAVFLNSQKMILLGRENDIVIQEEKQRIVNDECEINNIDFMVINLRSM